MASQKSSAQKMLVASLVAIILVAILMFSYGYIIGMAAASGKA